MARKIQVISGDSHLDMPPDRWVHHVPARWQERAPRRIKLAKGGDAFIVENRRPFTVVLQITGVPYEQLGLAGSRYGVGTGSPEQRLREQDQDGVDAEILFTHPVYINTWRGITDNEPYKAMIHAYNEWLAEEYCSFAPDRLIAMGIIPDTGVDDAIAEMEYCTRMGLKGVCLYKFPNGKGYPLPEDDRFWQASLDHNVPITVHSVGATTRFSREGPVFPYTRGPERGATQGRDPVTLMCRFTSESALLPLQLAFAGVFDRFPNLRIYCAETQIGWLPHCLVQIDDNYERNRHWGYREWGLPPIKRKPSEYIRDHFLWGFMKDPVGVRQRHESGVRNLMWGSDFAHISGDWPHSRKVIEETFVGVPEDEHYAMLAGNAIEFFQAKDTVPDVEDIKAVTTSPHESERSV